MNESQKANTNKDYIENMTEAIKLIINVLKTGTGIIFFF